MNIVVFNVHAVETLMFKHGDYWLISPLRKAYPAVDVKRSIDGLNAIGYSMFYLNISKIKSDGGLHLEIQLFQNRQNVRIRIWLSKLDVDFLLLLNWSKWASTSPWTRRPSSSLPSLKSVTFTLRCLRMSASWGYFQASVQLSLRHSASRRLKVCINAQCHNLFRCLIICRL